MEYRFRQISNGRKAESGFLVIYNFFFPTGTAPQVNFLKSKRSFEDLSKSSFFSDYVFNYLKIPIYFTDLISNVFQYILHLNFNCISI